MLRTLHGDRLREADLRGIGEWGMGVVRRDECTQLSGKQDKKVFCGIGIVSTERAIMDSVLKLENRHTGETLRMRRERDVSGQVVLIIEGSLPPGSKGPPPHVHLREREEVEQAGTLGARIGEQTLVVQTGGNAAFPAGVVHSWWNAGETLLEFNGRVVPAVDLGSIPPSFIRCAQRERDQQAFDLLSGSCALAASPHTGCCDAPYGDPTDFISCGPADWPRSREVQGTGLAGMPRNLQGCSPARSCDCLKHDVGTHYASAWTIRPPPSHRSMSDKAPVSVS